VRVVELAGVGPAPFCAMLLADMGAAVVRVDRTGPPRTEYPSNPVVERGRRSVAVDLSRPEGAAVLLRLVAGADVLVESFRPGVAERLGIGPTECLAANPGLVYGRMSGWGQDGPLARTAGHDINYIGLTGALHAIGRRGQAPVPPLNLVGDLGGGAMFLAFGLVCALLEVRQGGRGRVVDANVLDGTTALMGFIRGLAAQGRWTDHRGSNLLDSGAPWYDVYRCADGRYVAVGTVERKFFRELLDGLGLAADPDLQASHDDPDRWPALRTALAAAFATRPRDEWSLVFAGRDACVTPVLSIEEAPRHPQAVARALFDPVPGLPGVMQPAPAPRFDDARPDPPGPAPEVGAHTREVLQEAGFTAAEVDGLQASGAVR
jgi:alpha-methylacyl-CoA racemase